MAGKDKIDTTGVVAAPLSSSVLLTPRLREALENFRDSFWSLKIAEGALWSLGGVMACFLASFVCDRFLDTPAVFRWGLLAVAITMPLGIFPLFWYRWVWRRRSLRDSARALRQRLPRLGDEVLGLVELAQGDSQGHSPRLISAAMAQVEERIEGQDFSNLLVKNRRRALSRATLGIACLTGVLFGLAPDAARSSLIRWVSPWKEVPRYTFAQLHPLPAHHVVPFAEAFSITVTLRPTSPWHPAQGSLWSPEGNRILTQREEDSYIFPIPPMKEDTVLAYRVGDAYAQILIQPKLRPELHSLSAKMRLPDYLRYAEDPISPIRGDSFVALEGAEITLQGATSSELTSMEVEEGPSQITFQKEKFSLALPPLSAPLSLRLSWQDVHGLKARVPLSLQVSPIPDQAPEVYAHLVNKNRMVIVSEAVAFDLSASDDFGLRSMGLEWRSLDNPGKKRRDGEDPEKPEEAALRGEKLVAAGEPEKTSLQTRALFSAEREGLPPGAYEVRAFAIDFLPGRERSYSPSFALRILSPQEHARWIGEEFGKWLRITRESYEREQQMYDTNRVLQDQSAAELDQPESRHQIHAQSASEAANSQRLDALVSAGRDLIDEATKNREFNANQLDDWARTMSQLEEIARDDMPQVAKQLQNSAQAANGEKTTSPTDRTSAQESLDRAVEEQEKLLEKFAEATQQLQEVLADLEASTFVKRLKAAAQAQTEQGKALATTLFQSFGLVGNRALQKDRDVHASVADAEEVQSRFVRDILVDLEAYHQHKPDPVLKAVLDQMKIGSVVSSLEGIAALVHQNQTGRAMAACEFWADTLDRWAEELVAAVAPSQSGEDEQQEDKEGLPPDLVLRIMRSLRHEMQIRDETRETESARPGLSTDRYQEKVAQIEESQAQVREQIDEVVDAITEISKEGSFSDEQQLLETVSDFMRRSSAVLMRPDTGNEALAYQTEAIELLLQSKRQQSSSSSSSGDSQDPNQSPPPAGSGGGKRGGLSDIGPQDKAASPAVLEKRGSDPTSGRAGRELPDEFRRGLDLYFNKIDSASPPKP